jgi:hypothetical protein
MGVGGAVIELGLVIVMVRIERRTTDPSANVKAVMPALLFPVSLPLIVFAYWPPEIDLFVAAVSFGVAIAISGKTVSVAAAVR